MPRASGRWLIILGALHLLYGGVAFAGALADIGGDGLLNTVDGHDDREAAFWYFVSGLLIGLLGFLAVWAEARTGTLPRFLGWSLVGLGVAGVVLMPISPFWVVIAIGALLLWAPAHDRAAHAAPSSPATYEGRAGRPS